MGIYLSGVFVAFVLQTIRMIILLFSYFSHKSKNIRKIGLHFNLSIGDYTQESNTWKSIASIIVLSFVIEPLLSWVSVFIVIFSYLKAHVNKVPIPEKIKEINFKLSSLDLPKEEVKKYMNELLKFLKGEEVDIDDILNNSDEVDPDLCVLEDNENKGDWYREIMLNRKAKNYTIYFRSPDYDAQFTDINEYKFMDMNLLIRTIEKKAEHMGEKEYWDIKDNVVMELDIRKRLSEIKIANANWYKPESIEKEISSLKELVEWRECKEERVKYFIISRHKDLFSEFELKKYFRSELERINNGYKKLEDEIHKQGGYIIKESLFPEQQPVKLIKFNDGISEEQQKIVYGLIQEENIKQFNISYYEYEEVDKIRQDLERYIAKL